ncbi:hypothetical protein [Limnoglobus roseus]|uniref:Uncharacterized protein n=1 Tax=Limnoglobus roseus TaxID=2598579 RepID=A0A5C1AJ87_9BACT|nr:hypothetical protein [Limnoglobus roseus]QEL17772.1 hypothetical protein PX52LOC_04778 [Limnoglobus roseus]
MAAAADPVPLDEFRLTITVPRDLPDADAARARRTLDHPAFSAALGRLAAALVRRFPTLAAVTVAVSR